MHKIENKSLWKEEMSYGAETWYMGRIYCHFSLVCACLKKASKFGGHAYHKDLNLEKFWAWCIDVPRVGQLTAAVNSVGGLPRPSSAKISAIWTRGFHLAAGRSHRLGSGNVTRLSCILSWSKWQSGEHQASLKAALDSWIWWMIIMINHHHD